MDEAAAALPARIADLDALEESMSRPGAALRQALREVPGDIMVLGVGGKSREALAQLPDALAMGYANVISQGAANDWALRSLAHCTAPTTALNLSGPKVGIRAIAQAKY